MSRFLDSGDTRQPRLAWVPQTSPALRNSQDFLVNRLDRSHRCTWYVHLASWCCKLRCFLPNDLVQLTVQGDLCALGPMTLHAVHAGDQETQRGRLREAHGQNYAWAARAGSQGPELPTHDQPPVPSLPLTPNWDVPFSKFSFELLARSPPSPCLGACAHFRLLGARGRISWRRPRRWSHPFRILPVSTPSTSVLSARRRHLLLIHLCFVFFVEDRRGDSTPCTAHPRY